MGAANLTLRFGLELATLVALATWGVHATTAPMLSVTLAVAAPLAAALLWGAFVSPKALLHVTWPLRLCIELAIFCAAVTGLVASGLPGLAAVLAAAIALHQAWRAAELYWAAR